MLVRFYVCVSVCYNREYRSYLNENKQEQLDGGKFDLENLGKVAKYNIRNCPVRLATTARAISAHMPRSDQRRYASVGSWQ